MQLLKQYATILYCDDSLLQLIEAAGRTCYKTEDRITDDSYKAFIKGILAKGHESVIEHSMLTVRFVTDRGVSHEIVRHRLAAYSQESTRYVNYSKRGMQFIVPFWYKNICRNIDEINEYLKRDWPLSEFKSIFNLTNEEYRFLLYLQYCEDTYNTLINVYKQKPEQARAVLPNCVKTELVMTANFREWRHVFRLRLDERAHPQMRELMLDLYRKLHDNYPEIFEIMFADIFDK